MHNSLLLWSPPLATEKTIDRSEILSLLQEVVTKGVGNCASFSSRLDPNMKESFKNKLTSKNGVLDNKSIGFACKKGLKPRSPNQDAWAVVQGGDEFSMYLVCDGHGTDGHIISDLAINMIPKFILTCPNFKENLSEVMKRTFQRMHEFIVKSASAAGFDADLSGATSTIVFHDKQLHRITIAHVGDSGSLIGKRADGSSEVKAKVLVEDHKPENPEERARIESRGGRVEWDGYANHRVYGGTTDAPGINMSRALGDDLGHRIAGISYEPTVTIYDLEPEDRFLCVCSDGVWEFLKPDQVAASHYDLSQEQLIQVFVRRREVVEVWTRIRDQHYHNVRSCCSCEIAASNAHALSFSVTCKLLSEFCL